MLNCSNVDCHRINRFKGILLPTYKDYLLTIQKKEGHQVLNFFNRHYINRAILCALLSSCSLTFPLASHPYTLNINDTAFIVRMEKLMDKLINGKDKGNEHTISCFHQIKEEIEHNYNLKFDMNQYMDSVQKELKKKGANPDKKQFQALKKMMKGKEKKSRVQRNTFGRNQFLMTNACKSKTEEEDKDDEVVVPALLVYGVSVALCGMFLMCLPIPACKDWGGRMVVAGITASANCICAKTDKDREKEKK